MSEQLDGIQAAKQAGPGGLFETIEPWAGLKCVYGVNEQGEATGPLGDVVMEGVAFWGQEFRVIRVGPEKVEVEPKAEPYGDTFKVGFEQDGEAYVYATVGGFVANGKDECFLRVLADRLNKTMRAAKAAGDAEGYKRGKADGFEDGEEWSVLVKKPAVAKLLDELEATRGSKFRGLDLTMAGERFLAAVKPESKPCKVCHDNPNERPLGLCAYCGVKNKPERTITEDEAAELIRRHTGQNSEPIVEPKPEREP